MRYLKTVYGISLLLCLLASGSLLAQNEANHGAPPRLKFDAQFGFLAGGQIVNGTFHYQSGSILQFGVNKEFNSWIDAGIGVGLHSFEVETVLPVFIDIKAKFDEQKKASSFLGINAGLSSAWSSYYRNVSDYDFHGGFYFSPYYAFQFPMSDKSNFLVAFGLVHQIAEVELISDFGQSYEERFSLDFLSVRAGIRF